MRSSIRAPFGPFAQIQISSIPSCQRCNRRGLACSRSCWPAGSQCARPPESTIKVPHSRHRPACQPLPATSIAAPKSRACVAGASTGPARTHPEITAAASTKPAAGQRTRCRRTCAISNARVEAIRAAQRWCGAAARPPAIRPWPDRVRTAPAQHAHGAGYCTCDVRRAGTQILRKTRVPLVPPKPNEFFIAARIGISRATFAQ